MNWIGLGHRFEPNDVIGNNPGYVFGTLLALIAIGITIMFANRDKRSKTLDYEIITNSPLLSNASKRLPLTGLQLTWNGKNVNEPKLLEIHIENTGKEPIVADDFQHPVKIKVSDGRILGVSVSRTSSADLHLDETEWEQHTDEPMVTIKPALLNHGEFVVFQVIVDGYDAQLEVSSRFRGQDRRMFASRLSQPDTQEKGSVPALWIGRWVFLPLTILGFCFGPVFRNANPPFFNTELSTFDVIFDRVIFYVLGGMFIFASVALIVIFILGFANLLDRRRVRLSASAN